MITFYINQEVGFFAKKRTSACGEYDLFNSVSCLSYQALKYRRMFTINRDDRHPVLNSFLHDYITCHYQCFFIRKSNCFAFFNCFQGRFKACKSNYRCQHHIIAIKFSNFFKCFLSCENFYSLGR